MLCVVGVVQNIYTAHISRWLSRHACDSLLFVFFFFFFVWRFLSLLLLFLFRYIQQYFLPFSLYSILCGLNVCLLARTQQGQEPGLKKEKRKRWGFCIPSFHPLATLSPSSSFFSLLYCFLFFLPTIFSFFVS